MGAENFTQLSSRMTEEADALYNKIPSNEEIESFIAKHEKTSDPELLWRLARLSRILSSSHPDASKKKSYCLKMCDFANKGYELNPNSAGCNKYYAVAIMEAPTGQSEKAKRVHDVRACFKKAVEIDPQDATALLMLGIWHFRVADLPWLLRKIVNAVHSNPPTATYQEALEYFEKAEKVEPNFSLRNLLMLGKTHLRLKDNKLAKEYLQKAVDHQPKRPENEEFHKEAQTLLKGL
ncbi:regulator of microtubule dynamics protein 1-like [Actinia tenebrosa]|uniref:Regulator of microtubule dynamics protein 1-like n=1 Tax=Actinia tenebrosa TaxID=6105 RepID=A0A6P8IP68_ACTTE|nr:regulator of microtubule dynamics protein 1-like [Actinia tenebrosa]